MRMKLNTKVIKDSLIEELIRDKRIMCLLDCQEEHLKVHDIMNNKIFTYFKTYSTSLKSFICIDVDEYENNYKVRIKIECHEDLSESKGSRFYNKADEIAVYVKECINNVFPKATGYHNIPHYGSAFLIRDISFSVNAEDECVIPDKKKQHEDEHNSFKEMCSNYQIKKTSETLMELKVYELELLKSIIKDEISQDNFNDFINEVKKYCKK